VSLTYALESLPPEPPYRKAARSFGSEVPIQEAKSETTTPATIALVLAPVSMPVPTTNRTGYTFDVSLSLLASCFVHHCAIIFAGTKLAAQGFPVVAFHLLEAK